MKCNKCGSTEIRRRSNYSHGKKSKPIKILSCKKCGSSDIEVEQKRGRFRRR